MMEGDMDEQWTALGVSARFIRGCKQWRITGMILVFFTDSLRTPVNFERSIRFLGATENISWTAMSSHLKTHAHGDC